MIEHNPDFEIGCQVNTVTGEHYGPCRGTCKAEPELQTWTFEELLAESATVHGHICAGCVYRWG